MTDSRPLITTAFSLDGEDLDPSVCTREIGLEPTHAGRKGEKLRSTSHVALLTGVWTISVKQRSLDTSEGLEELLDILWPHRFALRQFLRKTLWEAAFSTSMTIREERPLYHLSAGVIHRISFFRVSYGMDIIDLSD